VDPGPPFTPSTAPLACTKDVPEASKDLPIGVRAASGSGGVDVSTADFEGVFSATLAEGPPARKRKRGPGRRGQPGASAKKSKRKPSTGNFPRSVRPGGRRAGTSVIDGIWARPSAEGWAQGPSAVNPDTSGERHQGQASREGGQEPEEHAAAPGGSEVPGHMSLEDQQAQASWTAAILKVGKLKPKSYKDYIRALRTYKVGQQPLIASSCACTHTHKSFGPACIDPYRCRDSTRQWLPPAK
jgi:hypothetical protein